MQARILSMTNDYTKFERYAHNKIRSHQFFVLTKQSLAGLVSKSNVNNSPQFAYAGVAMTLFRHTVAWSNQSLDRER